MEDTALTPKEYQRWKDIALLDGDIISRFAATIESRAATIAQLTLALTPLAALALADDTPSTLRLTVTLGDARRAREAIEAAKS